MVTEVNGQSVVVRNDNIKHKGLSSLDALVTKITKEEEVKAKSLAPNAASTAKATTTAAGKTATPAAAAGVAAQTNPLDDTTLRVDSLEKATLALAQAAREETEELKKLRQAASTSTAAVEKLINAKSEAILEKVVQTAQDEITGHANKF